MAVPVGGRREGGPMRNAARKQQDEAPPEPPRRDLQAEAAELLDRAGALVPALETAGAGTRAVNETIILALRLAELADALEGADAMEAVASAAYQQGRADAAAARDEASGRQPSRPRHAGRRRYLFPVPSIPATAARTAAAGIVVAGLTAGGIAAGMHDESAVYAAASPAGHAALHPMAPDRAVLVPSPSWSPSPRPSVAAATARPAPVAVPSPSVPASSPPPPAPVPSVTAAPPPVLGVPRFLDLGDSILGQLQLSATGPEEVAWTATATDGIRLSSYAGVVVPGEPVTLTVTDPTGNGGWAYISFGGTTVPVEVTSDVGTPVLALP